jgi:hypothetical protein
MAIRWWIKFGRIKANDPDFVRAKRAAIVVSIIAALVFTNAVLKLT